MRTACFFVAALLVLFLGGGCKDTSRPAAPKCDGGQCPVVTGGESDISADGETGGPKHRRDRRHERRRK